MLSGEEILEMIDATPEERDMIADCRDRIIRKTQWEETKRADPTIPRQRRYPGPTAAERLGPKIDEDPERFAALMEALRADLKERGINSRPE